MLKMFTLWVFVLTLITMFSNNVLAKYFGCGCFVFLIGVGEIVNAIKENKKG